MRSWLICLFINLFVCAGLYGQDSASHFKLSQHTPFIQTNNKLSSLSSLSVSQNFAGASSFTNVKSLPASFYYNSLGFFCQKELQVEKLLKVPLRFRLGNLNYTDRMEGKGQGYLHAEKKGR